MTPQEIHNITTVINALVAIKWALICIAVNTWGISLYFLLKEIPKWWHSFDKEKSNLEKLPEGTYEGGHY
jgi:hypothetical protein